MSLPQGHPAPVSQNYMVVQVATTLEKPFFSALNTRVKEPLVVGEWGNPEGVRELEKSIS